MSQSKSGNSDGISNLLRIEFEFDSKSYHFALNPEEYSQTEPNKATVTQTMGGAFVDQFGAGLIEFALKGTTGYKNQTKDTNNGFEKFIELRDLIRETYAKADTNKVLKFHNYTDDEHWNVFVERFSLSRSKSRPLLFQYDIKLIGLLNLSEPLVKNGGYIGNIYTVADTTTVALSGGYSGKFIYAVPISNNTVFSNDSPLSSKTLSTLSQVTNNLSVVVGGYNGKFSPMMAKYISSDISVLDTGEIPNIPNDNLVRDSETSDVTEMLYNRDFRTKISTSAAQLYKKVKIFDSDIIETNRFMHMIPNSVLGSDVSADQIIPLILNNSGGKVDSILVDASKNDRVQVTQTKHIKIILMEVMSIYCNLCKIISNSMDELNMSESEIDRVLNNIVDIAFKLEKSSPIPICTITELRYLYQNLRHVRALPEVFAGTGGRISV